MPIKPKEVQARKDASIPKPVFEAFNELILQKWDGHEARFTQDVVATLAIQKLKATKAYKDTTRQQMYDNHWLDVESAFRKAGWKVKYDKPGYNESYDAYFIFSK